MGSDRLPAFVGYRQLQVDFLKGVVQPLRTAYLYCKAPPVVVIDEPFGYDFAGLCVGRYLLYSAGQIGLAYPQTDAILCL